MSELLFEVGVEELPALVIEPALEFMQVFASAYLQEKRLSYKDINTYGTPRRLVLSICGLESVQSDNSEEILGPSTKIAFAEDGSFSKAALGFMSAKGLTSKDIYKKETPKGEVIAASVLMKGSLTKDLIPAMLSDIMQKIPFPKRMRWEASGDSFARPVRSLLVLFDGQVINFKFADVESGQTSSGHRFLYPEKFKVSSLQQYLSQMQERNIILDPAKRAWSIISQAEQEVARIGGVFKSNAELLNIVKNLVEYPYVILGAFEKKYLDIPQEILISEMTTHQKYFPVYDKSGKLLPYFICVAATKPYDKNIFAAGNARVLRARFEDGAFYYAKDKEITLTRHAQNLTTLVFERELGTLAQKSERIKSIALNLQDLLKIDKSESQLIEQTADLLKADLVTGVVGQFPELQGTMGKIYAEQQGLPKELCEAIYEHYLPKSAHDELPKSKLGAAFSIADKLDTLVGIIAIDKLPKGNKDPFALRRAAIGIVRIVINFSLRVALKDLVEFAIKAYGTKFAAKSEKLCQETLDFIVARARGILVEKLKSHTEENAANFADSVLAIGTSDLLDAFARADALFFMHNKNQDEFYSLAQTFKRAGNIVKKAENFALGDLELLKDPYEQALIKSVHLAKDSLNKTNRSKLNYADLCESYKEIFSVIALIKPRLDAFFDNTMVMVDDKNLRNARLNLLADIKNISDQVADFTHLL